MLTNNIEWEGTLTPYKEERTKKGGVNRLHILRILSRLGKLGATLNISSGLVCLSRTSSISSGTEFDIKIQRGNRLNILTKTTA